MLWSNYLSSFMHNCREIVEGRWFFCCNHLGLDFHFFLIDHFLPCVLETTTDFVYWKFAQTSTVFQPWLLVGVAVYSIVFIVSLCCFLFSINFFLFCLSCHLSSLSSFLSLSLFVLVSTLHHLSLIFASIFVTILLPPTKNQNAKTSVSNISIT